MSIIPGQLFMAGFDGVSIPDEFRRLLQEEALGGVVLFSRNITSLEQLRHMIHDIRQAADRPICIGVDHEGGRVFRLPKPFTQIPPMAELGAYAARHTDGEQLATQLGKLMATELRAVGFNLNFAPVLDINTNNKNPIIGDRAFGATAELVSKLGCAMIRGMREGGLIACAKHFPGHGDTPEDSHRTMPVLPHTWDRLRWMELVPFRAAIKQGVPMIMTAHILYGVIDAANPVSLSKRAITSLLREEMGYEGVIVSDDLEMGGIVQNCPPEEAAVRALAAGTDMVMICKDTATTERAIARVRGAIESGELLEERLEQSAMRLQKVLKHNAGGPSHDLTRVGDANHRAILKRLAA